MASATESRISPTQSNSYEKKTFPKITRKTSRMDYSCSACHQKRRKRTTRFTVGCNCIVYPGAVATPTADMLVTKLLFNSVISTKGARFMTIDISDFYHMTPLKQPKFICISINDIPEEIVIKYKLREIADSKGMVYSSQPRNVRAPTIRTFGK